MGHLFGSTADTVAHPRTTDAGILLFSDILFVAVDELASQRAAAPRNVSICTVVLVKQVRLH